MEITLPAPSEKQSIFLKDKHTHIAFGGARGRWQELRAETQGNHTSYSL